MKRDRDETKNEMETRVCPKFMKFVQNSGVRVGDRTMMRRKEEGTEAPTAAEDGTRPSGGVERVRAESQSPGQVQGQVVELVTQVQVRSLQIFGFKEPKMTQKRLIS